MLHVSMVGRAFAEVEATLITIDGSSLVCWASGEEPVARYGLDQVLSIRLLERPAARAAPEHPNAFRRWTAEQEGAIIEAYHRGDTFEQIAAGAGRRVGGVRARLIALGVIEPESTDRLRFPGTPATAVAAAAASGAGVPARPRALLRVVEPVEGGG